MNGQKVLLPGVREMKKYNHYSKRKRKKKEKRKRSHKY